MSLEKLGEKKEILFSFRLLLSIMSAMFIYLLTAGIFIRVLSNPFFKSKIPLQYPKILMILTLIII